MGPKVYTTRSPKETQNLGKKIAKSLKDKRTLCLYGELGSGKTTFIQGFAQGLGIKKRIISPTFIFMREYPLKNGKQFYHLDCYRLKKLNEAKNLGLSYFFDNPSNIIAIEWAEKIRKILPGERIDIKFENLGENKRKITVKQ